MSASRARAQRWLAQVALVVVAAAAAATAHADTTVTVTLTPSGQQLAQDFGDSEAALIQKMKDKIDAFYQTARIPALLDAFVTTTGYANRGLGVDYATREDEAMVGAMAAGVIDTDVAFRSKGHLTTGEIVNFSVMAGVNLGRWQHPKWTVFANAFYEAGSLKALDGHLTTGAAHVQYRAIAPTAPGVARWTGVDLTTGVEVARWTLSANRPITTSFVVQGTNAGVSKELVMTSTGTLALVATTATIPLEVTTGATLFDVVGVYAGGGIDLTIGTSTLTASLDGTLVADNTNNIGTVSIVASGGSSAPPLGAHLIGGVQLNAPHFHFCVQGLVAPSVYGLSTGVRFAW